MTITDIIVIKMRRIDPYLFDGIAKKFVLLFALSVVLKLIKVKTMWYDRWMMFECFDLVAWFEANSKWQAPELPLEKANFVECHVVFCPNSEASSFLSRFSLSKIRTICENLILSFSLSSGK